LPYFFGIKYNLIEFYAKFNEAFGCRVCNNQN
jgi:hypothetical protein